jgi:hypothetical protein
VNSAPDARVSNFQANKDGKAQGLAYTKEQCYEKKNVFRK